MINILYFASIRERVHCSKEDIELSADIKTISDLKNHLSKRGSIWSDIFEKDDQLLFSVNQMVVKTDQTINDNDEVAFFPQVTGG